MGRLEGRRSIVTGASRGLGRAIAIALAAEGAAVAVVARSGQVWDERLPGTVGETVDAIIGAGGLATGIVADVADEDDLERIVREASERLGPIDLLVNNAALTVAGRPGTETKPRLNTTKDVRLDRPPSILEVPLKAYRRHFAVNVFAPYRLIQLVLPVMIAGRRGAIVNVSSRSAFNPGPGPYEEPGRPALFAYGSSKAALHNLTQAAAVEAAASAVPVNVVIPSRPIHTPGTDYLMSPSSADEWSTPQDFAEAVVRLAVVDPAVTTGQILWHEDVLATIPAC